MKRLIPTVLGLALLSGCAMSKKAVATNIVAASDATADSLAATWEAATEAKIEECRQKNLATKEQRAYCLGPFHPDETEKVIAAVQTLVAVQLAVKEAAECESLGTCLHEIDWFLLAEQANEAWQVLKPYVLTMKEAKQ